MERLHFEGYTVTFFLVIFFFLNASWSTLAASESSVLSNGGNCTLYKNCTPAVHKKQGEGISVAKINFSRVDTPFIVAIWILLGSLAKLVFHLSDKLSTLVPESCLLILLGIPIGLVLKELGVKDGDVYFTSELFFLFLLPPIILDAGYFMPVKVFYQNIGTILLYATVGTVFNAFALGCALYLVRDAVGIGFPLLHLLLFGSFISAVDPVAVLAVFEEVHVHETLYILVFGESVLNDAASVVLYNTFEALTTVETVQAKDIGLAFVSFFVVSLGGTSIGVVWGLLTSFVTRFTEHVRVIEPIFVFIMAYMAYLCAEIFHFSGIMSILFCGMVMKPYVESNVSRKSHTTIKYFLKLIASTSETIIFMFLGVSMILNHHSWNVKFILFTLFFMVLFRTIGVIAMTAAANTCGRLIKISKVEQFIMSYGGLRGAVAFSLSILINVDHVPTKQVLVTTTTIVVLFTVFLQGITIKPLVRCLRVRRAESREKTMSEQLNDKLLEHLVAGMEEILGHHGHGFWRDVIEYYNRKYLRKILERDPNQGLDEELILASRRLAFKNALDLAQNPNQLFQKADEWSCVRRNPSYAVALAMRENSSLERGDPQLDIGVLTGRCLDDEDYSDAFIHYNAACLIPRAKRSLRQRASIRKYSLASLGENEYEDRYMKVKRNALAHMAPPVGHHHHHHRHRGKHKRHNRRGHSKKPGVDTLPEMTEDERDSGPVLDRKASIASESSEPDSGGIIFNAREDDPHHAYSEDIPMITNPFKSGHSDRPRKDSGARDYFRRGAGEPGRGFPVSTPPPARRESPRSPPQDSSPPLSRDSPTPLTQDVSLSLKENSFSPTDDPLSLNSDSPAMEDSSKLNHDDPLSRSAGDVHIDVPDDSKM